MRSYMVAALLKANAAGAGFKGGGGAGGNAGAGYGPGAGAGAGGWDATPDSGTRAGRNGRNSSTSSTPTKRTEDNENPHRSWYPCKTCCNACERNAPKTWNVTIPGSAGAVVLSRVVAAAGCRWEWNGRQTSGCAAYPWMEQVVIIAGTTQWQLYVVDADQNLLFNWFNTTGGELDCGNDIEDWGTYSGASCANPGAPTVAPGDDSGCCECDACCDSCEEFSPQAWEVEIADRTYVVPRNILEDGEVSCNWVLRLPEPREICGVEAIQINIHLNAGSTTAYCRLVEAEDGSATHTLWMDEAIDTPVDCTQPLELPYDSGHCSTIASVTITPIRLKFCPQGSAPECPWCDDGTVPAQLEITVSGVVNYDASSSVGNKCTDCPDLNGTYILDSVNHPSAGTICEYRYVFDDPVCEIESITAFIFNGMVRAWFACDAFGYSVNGGREKTGLGNPQDCMYSALAVNQLLTSGSGGGCVGNYRCDITGIVFTVTGIP